MKSLKKIITVCIILFSIVIGKAQVGIGTTAPDGALDITSSTDGLLIPRVALTITTSALPLTSPTISELVYNSATVADVTPGYYYWDGGKWVRLADGIVSNDWSILGNSGTTPATNFIGTTDDNDLIFRRNNLRAGRLGSDNTSFGLNSLNPFTTGTRNTAIGANVLNTNTSGTRNTAIGENTLFSNTTGGENVAMGAGSLFSNTIGNQNTAIGRNALTTNSTGGSNTGLGYLAMRDNTIGEFNTAVGRSALLSNNVGIQNSAIGVNALFANTVGNYNSVLGVQAGRDNTSGNNNTAVGYQSLFSNLAGNNNVAIGNQAGFAETGSDKLYISNSNTTPTTSLIYGEFSPLRILRTNSLFQIGDPIGTGYQFPIARGTANQILQSDGVGVLTWVDPSALSITETDPNAWKITGNTGIVDGTNFIGTAALTNVDVAFRRNNFPAGKIGLTSTSFGVGALNAGAATNSSAFGTNALTLNTGADNVAVGNGSLAANTTGSTNVAVGNSTLSANVSGIQNTGVGHNALFLNNTGFASTAIGFEALRANTSGNNGTAVGFQALRANTSANNNTAIGFQTMLNNTTGSQNTAVGFQASSIGATGSKNTSVGYIALNSNIGTENTAVGHSSMSGINNAASRFNTAIGYQSMFAGNGSVSNVVAVGANALFQNRASNATAVGYNALQGQVAGATGNTGVGFSVLNNNANGDNNTAVGNEAGFAATGSDNTLIGNLAGQFSTGSNNVAVGSNTLRANGLSANSVAIGVNALTGNTATSNTAVGFHALRTNGTGTGNVAIGNRAGENETTSNKLYIENSNANASNALIYGEFDTNILRTNSTFQIGDPTGTGYQFPVARGADTQILQTNATGVLSWVNPSALTVTEIDPQVSSVTTNAVPKWDGTTLVDGIITDNGTSVTVAGNTTTTTFQMTNGATANYILQSNATGNATWVDPATLAITETDPQVSSVTANAIPKWNGTTLVDGIITDNGTSVTVAGNTTTTTLQMTNGATANYILQSDATGNASWVPNPLTTLSAMRINLSANQALGTAGWEKINFDTAVFDTKSEFAGGTFTATTAGIYQVNAGFHTDNQSNGQFYSIGVYVNGTLYQETTGNHYNNGPVHRNINCMVNLAAGGTVEIYVQNYQPTVAIDSFATKTFFEVQQIR